MILCKFSAATFPFNKATALLDPPGLSVDHLFSGFQLVHGVRLLNVLHQRANFRQFLVPELGMRYRIMPSELCDYESKCFLSWDATNMNIEQAKEEAPIIW